MMENKKHIIVKSINELSENGQKCNLLYVLSSHLDTKYDINTFRKNNGLKMLLDFLDDNLFMLEVLKILAYCCNDNKTRLQLLKWDSIPSICKLLKKLEDKEELKMACKVVSNLCCNKLCRLAVHDDAEALDTFVSCLWWSNLDESFLLIYIKALRTLSKSQENCERMVQKGVVGGVCALLNKRLSYAVTREVLLTIKHFFKRWSKEVKRQFLEAATLKKLAFLASQEGASANMVYQFIITSLLNNQYLLKYFGSSGILSLFIRSYKKSSTFDEKTYFLTAIYVCCKEANNRAATLHDHDFLDLLLSSINHPRCNQNLLLRTIICYKYNFEATKYLISHHILSSCIKLLSQSTSFNLPEMTSKLLYVHGELANSITVHTPVSPSTFIDDVVTSNHQAPPESHTENTPTSEISLPLKEPEKCMIGDKGNGSSKAAALFEEESSEDEELNENDFSEDDEHLFELARVFELERRNRFVYDRVSSACNQGDQELKKKTRVSCKKIKLDSNFCLKSTLDTMTSPDQPQMCEEKAESTEVCIFNLINHLVGLPASEKYLNRLESIRTLIYNIPATSDNHKLAHLLAHVSQNPLYFKLLISEMLVPMIDLFCKISSHTISSQFYLVKTNLSNVCLSNYAPTVLQELLSADHTRLQCAISLCYLARKGSKAESYLTQASVMEALVKSMFDEKHPLRLLSINGYCHLLSSVSAACECDVEEDNEEEEKGEEEYDVSFMVGEECIRSRKSRLVCHSEVFRAMFEGAFSEASTGQVVITGSSPEAFSLFNESLLSGRFNPLLFEVENTTTLLGVLQLANRYMVKRLEERIVSLVCSNMPEYFEGILKSNTFLASRPLLARCILHACQEILNVEKYETIIYLFKYISKEDFIGLSVNLLKLECIHTA